MDRKPASKKIAKKSLTKVKKPALAKKPPVKLTRKVKLGTSLKRFLVTNKVYDKSDDVLLEHINDIVDMMAAAKKSIIKDGVSFDVSKPAKKGAKAKPYYHRNQNVSLWLDLKKMLNEILQDNNLTVKERQEIMLQIDKNPDDFSKTFS